MKEQNIKELIDQLVQEGPDWKMEENNISKLSDADRKMLLGGLLEEGESSFEEVEKKAAASFEQSEAATVQPPVIFNWHELGKTSLVLNQGQCGSCVAFGASTTLATQAIIDGLAFPKIGVFPLKALSAAYLFYCVAASQGRNCKNGWYVGDAVQACADKGVPYYMYFPYTAGDQPCKVKTPWDGIKANNSGSYTNINDMRTHISSVGPLVTRFNVYSDFYKYKSGIYSPGPNAKLEGGHCVSVVGYCSGMNIGTIKVPPFWVCQNSWGADWGMDGFFYIKAGTCGIDARMYYMTNPVQVNNVS